MTAGAIESNITVSAAQGLQTVYYYHWAASLGER